MARKTVMRRLCKYIPSSVELERVISADPEVDIIDGSTGRPVANGKSKTEQLAEELIPQAQPQPESAPQHKPPTANGAETGQAEGGTAPAEEPPAYKPKRTDHEKQKEGADLLMEMNAGNYDDAADQLEELTHFVSTKKDTKGQMMPGVRSMRDLTGVRLNIALAKIKEAHQQWQDLTSGSGQPVEQESAY